MKTHTLLLLIFTLPLLLYSGLAAQNKINYEPGYEDPVLKEIEEKANAAKARRDSVTAAIREQQHEAEKTYEESKGVLRVDFSDVDKPASPDVFEAVFHQPPLSQDRSGTCWSFSGISFIESEIFRITGRKVKLSELYIVYFEYIEKTRAFVARRGDFYVSEGSISDAVTDIISKYGIVPQSVYPGHAQDERIDHEEMAREVRSYLAHVKDCDLWDEADAVAHVRIILDKYMGTPPPAFEFEGETVTPFQFANDVLKIRPDDYVTAISTMSAPFYTQTVWDVWDNWRQDSTCCNLPLDDWYGVIKDAIRAGYSVIFGGDITEPGYVGFEDAAVVPECDIPVKYINQEAREYRIYNKTTRDDHGIHVVGYKKIKGYDWFLIKDSSSRGRHGHYYGYFFYRGDYVRLKMLCFMVHKDAMNDQLEKCVRPIME